MTPQELERQFETWAIEMPEGYDRFCLIGTVTFGQTAAILGEGVPTMIWNTHERKWIPLLNDGEVVH